MVTPHRSQSRWILVFNASLMVSRLLKVSSKDMRAMMSRRVDCVNTSMASGRFCTWYTATRGSEIRKYTSASIFTITLSDVMTWWQLGKSMLRHGPTT